MLKSFLFACYAKIIDYIIPMQVFIVKLSLYSPTSSGISSLSCDIISSSNFAK